MEIEVIKEIRLAGCHKPTTSQVAPGCQDRYPAVAIVRNRYYGSALSRFQGFYAIACQTFPDLKPENVQVVHYGGSRHAGTYGIEFNVGDITEAPEGWSPIESLEYTR